MGGAPLSRAPPSPWRPRARRGVSQAAARSAVHRGPSQDGRVLAAVLSPGGCRCRGTRRPFAPPSPPFTLSVPSSTPRRSAPLRGLRCARSAGPPWAGRGSLRSERGARGARGGEGRPRAGPRRCSARGGAGRRRRSPGPDGAEARSRRA